MTLGEHIQELRKKQQLSQEDVGVILGVSRQAVSKWENDQSLPDTGNLLAMAELFGVSADELAGNKQATLLPVQTEAANPPPSPDASARFRHTAPVLGLAAALLAAAIALFLIPAVIKTAVSPAASAVSSTPADSSLSAMVDAASEFTLYWFDSGVRKQLSLGQQDTLWDFGQGLATYSVSEPQATDWAGVTVLDYLCSAPETAPPTFGTFSVTVLSNDGSNDPPARDYIVHLATVESPFTTPRGIHPGSSEAELVKAYGDQLLFGLKLSGSDLLCQHDYFYIYNEGMTQEIVFYIANCAVAGIELADHLDAQGYTVNNVSVFPVKDGAADFSARVDPELEQHQEPSLLVYQSFYAIEHDQNLSPEDLYQTRRKLFSNLAAMDWRAYGDLTCTTSANDDILAHNEQAERGRGVLLTWLSTQPALSADEILWLQQGDRAAGLDGWTSEEYASVLANALFLSPVEFTSALSDDGLSAEEARFVVLHTLYGAEVYPDQVQTALDAIRNAAFSGKEKLWADFLLQCFDAGLEQAGEISLPDALC